MKKKAEHVNRKCAREKERLKISLNMNIHDTTEVSSKNEANHREQTTKSKKKNHM